MASTTANRSSQGNVDRPGRPAKTAGVDRFLRWTLVVTLILMVGLLVLGTVAAYRGAPPIPQRVTAPDGTILFTGPDIIDGKAIFQRTDLMDFGSLFGNGAYFGPDWGTDYLHREVVSMRDFYASLDFGTAYAGLDVAQRTHVDARVVADLQANRYVNGDLALSEAQAAAYRDVVPYYERLFTQGDPSMGLQSNVVKNPAEARQLTDFFGWAAWVSTAHRPGHGFSYTNDWPYEPGAGNEPTHGMWVWSWFSIVGMVVVGAGVFWFYHRFIPHHPATIESPAVPEGVSGLTPSQRSTWKWFLLVPVLLLAQAAAGMVLAHYYSDRRSFYGLDIRSLLPFNVVKAWHLQFAIAWVAAAWMGAGLFLAPIVGRREPRGQRALANLLFTSVVVVVIGSSAALWLGVRGDAGKEWFWFGNQGLEYIQLGRAFQLALFAALLMWVWVLARAFWPTLRRLGGWGSVEHLLLYSGLAIGIVYVFGMLPMTQIMANATLTDYWRWWVVHLWVENMFEFFTVAVIGFALLSIGLLSRKMVERTVYLELILIFGTGLIGMGHHFYWAGEPAVWIAFGSTFSMLEVIPLTIMLVRAGREYRSIRDSGGAFPQRTAFMFFTWAAIWNFIGAGILGGITNPPIASYYEHGTFLTLAHAHSSMFGVFGLLALGLVYFGIRAMIPSERWSDRPARWILWLFNAAIVLWLALNLIPLGIAQLVAVVDHGYAYARSLEFYRDWEILQWLRLAGDAAFLAAGLVLLWDLVQKLRVANAILRGTPERA